MADLSQYVDFNVKIDNSGSTPKISVTDISSYPSGASAFQGFVKVTQPDGISVGPGSTADITDALRTADKPYRFASDGGLQNGTYTVEYVVKCAGYDDTTVTKTFILGYVRPTIVLAPQIDAFTPFVKVKDSSDFFQMGLIILTISRLWNGRINSVLSTQQTVTGTGQILDFAYNNNYYDALYYASLSDTVTYQLAQYPFAYVVEKITNQTQFDVYKPMTISEFQKAIYALEANSMSACGKADTPQVLKANQLLDTIMTMGVNKNTVGLEIYTDALYNLLYPGKGQTHTNEAIPSYIFSDSPSVPLVTLPGGLTASIDVGGIPAGTDLGNANILDAFVNLVTGGSAGGVSNAWYGWGATQSTPADPSTLQKSTSFASNGPLLADFSDNTATSNYLKVATLSTDRVFTEWEYNGMTGGIDPLPGGSNLFFYVEVNGLRYYVTNYPTILGSLTLN